MKTWEMPKIIAEKFTANEYCSTCGEGHTVYNFECNAGTDGVGYAIRDSKGNIATISGMRMNGITSKYTPCGKTHEADADDEFLTGYHLDNRATLGDEDIEVIIWTDNGTNVHCTTKLDMTSWTTAKS